MGLLDKAITNSDDIKAVIVAFQQKNTCFHCVVLQFIDEPQQGLSAIAEMAAHHGLVCGSLPRQKGFVLLPGNLDMELFSHHFSKCTRSSVIFAFSADSSSLAFETLKPYL